MALVDASLSAFREAQQNIATLLPGQPVATPQPAQQIQQPASPLVGAFMMAARGVRQTPLQPRTKQAFKPSWEQTASTDVGQINSWAAETPSCNWGSVATAQPNGIWIFDADNVAAVSQRIAEAGHKFGELKTFQVRSSPKKGHSYFRHNAASIALAGLKSTISVKDATGEVFSARLNNAYVVAPGSIHPDTELPYEIVNAAEIVEAPNWLIEWIKAQLVVEKKLPVTASSDGPRVPRGSHDNELIRIAGKLRRDGLEEEEIYPILVRNVEERFDDYGSDYLDMCAAKAKSACTYPKGDGSILVLHGGKPVEQIADEKKQQYVVLENQIDQRQLLEETEPEIDDTGLTPRPVFPAWVMEGTSLYEHLVKPVIAGAPEKHEELVFMPGVLMFLNAIALRVRLKAHRSVPNMFLGLVSPYGKFFKSSSCEASMDYFKQMGFAASSSVRVANPAITTLIITPASPEGLALAMKRAHGSKAVMYFDELGTFCAKAGIEHSTFVDKMLTFYEAKQDGNTIKSKESSYELEGGTYAFSWLWATTDRKLPALWSKLTGTDSGLNNRIFFLLSPEKPKESGLYQEPLFNTNATRKLIGDALSHNVVDGVATYDYEAEDQAMGSMAAHKVQGMDPRSQALFEHLALYFAIDLGKDCIDDTCCERAEALVKYRNESEAYLDLFQAESREGKLSHEIIRELKRNNGKMKYRDLYHTRGAVDLGLSNWNKVIDTLKANGIIATRNARKGKAGEQVPAMVYLLKQE